MIVCATSRAAFSAILHDRASSVCWPILSRDGHLRHGCRCSSPALRRRDDPPEIYLHRASGGLLDAPAK